MILSGKDVKNHFIDLYKNELKNKMIKVAIFENIYDEASVSYAKQIKKLFKKVEIDFISIQITKEYVNGNKKTKEVILKEYKDLISKYNHDKKITGIFIQMPLVGGINKNIIIENLNPEKDIEGITYYNLGKLFAGDETIVPPTANAIIKLAEYYNIDFKGKLVAIVNRSLIVGKPLIPLLLNRDATVITCHSKTTDLKNTLKNADIIISAAGKTGLITKDYVKKGAIVLDAAINFKNGKMCGDAEYEQIKEIASITPVPGGIGPVTNTMILRNILNLYKINNT